MRIICCILLSFFITTAFADPEQKQLAHSPKALGLGLLPFMSPMSLLKRFSPLRNYMAEQLQRDVYIESAPNFGSFIERTQKGDYDIVYTAPHFVELALKSGHYELIAAPARRLKAHVMVRNDSQHRSINDLAGMRIAHGPSKAFLVLIARDYFASQGLVGEKAPQYLTYQSHNAAYRAVAAGEADAAIVGTYIVDKANSQGLKELTKTPTYPAIAFLASTRLDAETRESIRQVMLNMDKTPLGKNVIKRIRFDAFVPVHQMEYAPLIKLLQYLPELQHFLMSK